MLRSHVPLTALLAALAGAVSYLGTRWNLSSDPDETSNRSVVSSSSPELHFPSGKEGRIAFVHTMVPLLQRHGLTHDQAVLFAAHIARETGWGRWIHRNNVGNIKAGFGWTGESFFLTDRYGFHSLYRAYPTPDAGIEDNLALVRNAPRYRKSWSMLLSVNPNWYGQLGLDGYYERPPDPVNSDNHAVHTAATIAPSQHDYDGVLALARGYDQGASFVSTQGPETQWDRYALCLTLVVVGLWVMVEERRFRTANSMKHHALASKNIMVR